MVCYCCVKGCNNNSNNSKKDSRPISFHAFPANPELRQKWLRAIGRPAWNPPNYVRICSSHFSTDKINQDGYRTRIKDDACPVNSLPLNSNFEASHVEVCRICLATDVDMFSLEIGVLKNCMENIVGFNENNGNIEGLPRFVCYECAGHLTKFYKFIEKSKIAQATLLDIFAKNSQITKSLVIQRDQRQSTLTKNYSTPCHYFEYIYNDKESTSYLKDKYYIGNEVKSKHTESFLSNNANNKFKEISTKEVKCGVPETSLKYYEKDVIQDLFNNNETDSLSDNELYDKDAPNMQEKYEEDIKLEKKNEIKLEDLSENKEETELIITDTKSKNQLNIDVLKLDKVDIKKYFVVKKLSTQKQIEEWHKTVQGQSFTSEVAFKCDVCSKCFVSRHAFEKHVIYHDPKSGAFECPVCKVRFKNEVLVKSHVNRSHEKKFHCKSCSKVLNSVGAARKHLRWHAGHVYRCGRCAFASAHASSLAAHARAQHPAPHACARCGHAFRSARGLALHAAGAHRDARNETITAEFPCEECGINFTSEGARRVHILTSKHHKTQTTTEPMDPMLKNTCKCCGVQFATRKELADHSRTEHRRPAKKTTWKLPGDSYPTRCDHCEFEVNNRKEHWWHVRKEHPTLRHQYRAVITAVCETCGKGFQNITKLRMHELHHGSPSFRCGACARAFHDPYARARHAAAHAPRTTHACALCSRAFALKGNLRRHERVHSGAAPFGCGACARRFRHAASARQHERRAHHALPHPTGGQLTSSI